MAANKDIKLTTVTKGVNGADKQEATENEGFNTSGGALEVCCDRVSSQ